MKKQIALVLALVLTLGLTACGGSKDKENTDVNVPASALEILNNIWNGVSEEKRFFAAGGSAETMVDNAPGNYALDDEGITSVLLVPQEQLQNIDQAASLVHAMMLNNFTAGAFHVAEGKDANAFAEAMYTAISGNQWMCGMPEHVTIAVIGGEYVLVYFGVNDVLEGFASSFKTVYPDADVRYDEAITG